MLNRCHIVRKFWQNSEWQVLGQWDRYCSEKQLNSCEVHTADDDDDDDDDDVYDNDVFVLSNPAKLCSCSPSNQFQNYCMELEISLARLQNAPSGSCSQQVQSNPQQLGPEVFLSASRDTNG